MDESKLPRGIMVSQEDDVWHSYRVECMCYDPIHDFSFDIELDKELNEINLVVSANMHTKYFSYRRNWFLEKICNFFERIKLSLGILFTGYYETTGCFTFKDEEQIDNLITAINYSRERLRQSLRKYGEYEQVKE